MKATQIIRDQRDIANFRNERNKIYDRTLNQLTNGDPSKADARTERRAARLADKVINKDPGYQADRNRYNQAIKNTVSRDTEISAQDATFQATRIFDEDTGKEVTQDTDEGGKPLTRTMSQIRSVKNLETGQKTALGRAIKGRARNLDQGELPEEQTRDAGASREEINQKTGRPQIISVPDESADVTGGLIGSPLASSTGLPTSGGGLTEAVDVPVIERTQKFNPNTGKTQTVSKVVITQTTGALPLGEGTQARAPRGQVRKVVETPGDESKTDFTIEGAIRDESGKLIGGRKVPRAGSTLSGYSPYGKEVGKFISGAMDKEGNYTNEAKGAVFVGPGQGLYDAGDTFKDDKGKTRFLRNQPGAQQPRKPSEPVFENTGLTSREERNMGNIPSEQLRSRITTDRTGQLRKTARDARIELLSRGATVPAIPPSREERESRLTFFLPGGTGEAKSTVPQKPAPVTRLEPGQRGPASSLQDRPPIGGSDPGGSAQTNVYNYNGTSWSSNPHSLPTGVYEGGSAGTQTSAIIFAGRPPSPFSSASYEYDGSSWTSGGTMGTGRRLPGGGGTQTSCRASGGVTNPSTVYTANSEEYDGTSWSEGPNLNTARRDVAGSGANADAQRITGGSGPAAFSTKSEAYDGTSWTEGPDLATGRQDSSPSMNASSNSTFMAGGYTAADTAPGGTEEFTRSSSTITAAAYSSGGSLNTGRSEASGGGSQTAAIMVGGCVPSSTNKANVENYDGTSWSEGPDINTARRNGGGSDAGTQTAMLIFGGYDGSPTGKTEYWNGSSWAEQPDMNVARFSISGCGVYNSAMAMGGDYPPGSPPRYAGTESWNGSTWSTAPNLNTGRNGPAACGVSNTAALCVGGDEYPDATNKCEEYDGSSWTTGGNLPAASAELSAGGPQTSAMAYLGSPQPSVGTLSCGYDGTSWSTRPNRANNRATTSAAGDAAAQTAGLVFGGTNASGTQQSDTEEFTGEVSTVTSKTLTTS